VSIWTWTITPEAAETRADVALLTAIEASQGQWQGDPLPCSRSQLQRLMTEGQILADGGAVQSKSKLKAGTQVEIRFPPPKPSHLTPEDRPLDILYQDSHIVVVNKPPGLTVHPSETQSEGTLVHALLHHVRDLSGIGGESRPGIVHRIDKNTSGVLVITKTDAAHRALAETFAKHAIERKYWAFCFGTPPAASGKIESLIGRNPLDRKKMSMEVKEGRRAVTHYRRVEEYGTSKARPFASWIEATLETGRTHQVRVHLTGLGTSLLGDRTYGVPSERQPKWLALPLEVRELTKKLLGQALHARVLGFDHPITGEKMRFEAEPPEQLKALMSELEKYR
jgi:23S rRNA pseudouridine1911/1915/1917 synthase